MTRSPVETYERAVAIGYAQRRTWLFIAWGYGGLMAVCGAVYGGLSAIVGQNPEAGLFMAIFGLILAAVGWIVTVGPRFTKKLPKPASDIPRVEQAIRTNPPAIKLVLILGALGIAALALFTPAGLSAETLPVFGLLVALSVTICGVMAYTTWLLKNSAEVYAQWLKRR